MNRADSRRLLVPWLLGASLAMSTVGTGASAPSVVQMDALDKSCQACHGMYGEGMPAASAPRLAGQAADYLQKQLNDYASGARENPIMVSFAKQLSEIQRANLATYYASQRAQFATSTIQTTPAQLARGRQLAKQGDETLRAQACNNCHGPDGSGLPHSAPYLAGQSAEYLTAELRSWQEGTRHNDAGKLMASVAERLREADIQAAAAYYASLTSGG